MNDFVKLDISYMPESELLDHTELKDLWDTSMNLSSAELKYPICAEVDNLKFILKSPNYRILQGSLHKYYNIRNNLGEQNYDLFTLRKIRSVVLDDLPRRFNIQPDKANLINLEYGLNLDIGSSPKHFIEDNIITYKNRPITALKNYGGRGYYTVVGLSNYSIKIYDKSLQYQSCKEPILRIEVHAKKSVIFSEKGICTLKDLTKKDKQEALGNELLKVINNLRVIDSDMPPALKSNNKDQVKFQKYRRPNFWASKSSTDRYYHNKKCIEMIEKYDLYFPFYTLWYYAEINIEFLLNN